MMTCSLMYRTISYVKYGKICQIKNILNLSDFFLHSAVKYRLRH